MADNFNLKKFLVENKLGTYSKLNENKNLFGKYIKTTKEGGIDVIVSFEKPSEEELGLDYGTLEEIMEIKEIDGVKLFFVYI